MSDNQFGLDNRYFSEQLRLIVRDAHRYTPDEMGRALRRLANVACPDEEITRLRTEVERLELEALGAGIRIDELESEVEALKAPCVWRYYPDDDTYQTGCGECFQFSNDSDLQGNKFFYCYHCGHPINVPAPPDNPEGGSDE